MNYFQTIALLSWETRNKKRHAKALKLCKNFSLKPVHKTLYVGNLYPKERRQLWAMYTQLFNQKTDKYALVSICQTCFEDAFIDDIIKTNARAIKDFEHVQFPEKPSKY